jgi:hypothetical protein
MYRAIARTKGVTPYLLVVSVLLLGVVGAVVAWQRQLVLYHDAVQDHCNDASISLRKQVVRNELACRTISAVRPERSACMVLSR